VDLILCYTDLKLAMNQLVALFGKAPEAVSLGRRNVTFSRKHLDDPVG
jgi:hypothetical protein